jgi:hypothetical protein
LAGGLLLGLLAAGAACRRGPREPLLTYYAGEPNLSIRYPGSWTMEQAEKDGVAYRYFASPVTKSHKRGAVSVVLVADSLEGSLEQYASTYLAGNAPASAHDEGRPGLQGKSWTFASADGSTRDALLLLREPGKVYGLHAQGEAAAFAEQSKPVEEMMASLALERPAYWPEVQDASFGFSLRLPSSWKQSRRFSGGGTLLLQYTSPPVGADRDGQTVHASLTLTVEPLAKDDDLESFYLGTRRKLGDAFQLLGHAPWKGGGYVDVMRSETPVAVSRVKRYYRFGNGRGYVLAFEARDDAYPRVFRWYDVIASTFQTSDAKAR